MLLRRKISRALKALSLSYCEHDEQREGRYIPVLDERTVA